MAYHFGPRRPALLCGVWYTVPCLTPNVALWCVIHGALPNAECCFVVCDTQYPALLRVLLCGLWYSVPCLTPSIPLWSVILSALPYAEYFIVLCDTQCPALCRIFHCAVWYSVPCLTPNVALCCVILSTLPYAECCIAIVHHLPPLSRSYPYLHISTLAFLCLSLSWVTSADHSPEEER